MTSKKILSIISLYEISMIMGFFITSLSQQNLYIGILILFIICKNIPETISKKFIFSRRPNGATNCDAINQGGKTDKNGFPSGHTMFATFVFVYTLYECLRIKSELGYVLWSPIVVTGAFFIAMPITRVLIGCHTIPQVFGGFIFGVIWAGLFIVLEKNVFMKLPRYKKDKERFINSFNPQN